MNAVEISSYIGNLFYFNILSQNILLSASNVVNVITLCITFLK